MRKGPIHSEKDSTWKLYLDTLVEMEIYDLAVNSVY